MSRCKKAISVLLVIMLIMVPISPAATFSLPDTTGHWAEGEIRQLVGIGAITGYPDGTYRPQDTITRAEFSSVVRGTLNLQEVKGSTFSDVVGHWAQGRIEALIKEGIIDTGVYGPSYGPDEPITREEIAMMASRMVGKHGEPQSIPFNDAEEIRPAFRSDVIKAYQAGIITGYPDNTFRPTGTATRAEAAVMVTRALIADTIKDRSVGNTAVSGEYTTTVAFEDEETRVKVVVNDTMTGQPLEGIAVELIVTDKTVELFLHDPRGDYLPEVFVFEQEILDEYPEVERGSIIIAVGLIAWGALKTYSLATFLMGGIAIMKGTKVVTTTWLVKTIAKAIVVDLATQAIYTNLVAYMSRDGKLNYPTTFYVFEEPDGASAQIVKVPAGATGKEIDNAISNITGDVEIEIKLPPENAKGAYYYPDGTPKFYYVYPVKAIEDQTDREFVAELAGVWSGRYTAPQGETALELTIVENDGYYNAIFHFGPLETNPTVPEGLYYTYVDFNPDKLEIKIIGREWISRPANYLMVDLVGGVSLNLKQMSGDVLWSKVDLHPSRRPGAKTGEFLLQRE